ncbi:DUF4747 family protein [Chryseobacterium sp. WG14]|uniref:DUF4747 family protein n=1 Tax=Chryseobacterium sp. WG14 TaxID=2926909 RepID=UPI00211EF08A|nr:DUF4747 family protein [Chryseobacterium sp. WG14]MCQ9640146.1 DUF4747 family protein [Chryseobacterium sp. WG14]
MSLIKKDYTEEQFNIINIKIHSKEDNKQALYSQMINQIFNFTDFNVKIGNKNGLVLKKIDKNPINKSLLGSEFYELQYKSYEIYECEFIKYKIEDEKDKHYDTKRKEIKPGNPNAVVKPNAYEIPFYFIPAVHRLLLPIKSKVTPKQVELFFKEALLKIYETESYFNIDIAKSVDEVEKIFNFKTLDKLQLEISYTNDDLGDDEKLFMDTLLKESNVNKYKAEFDSEKKESLNLDSKLIKGGIELSKENGTLKATGTNSFDNKVIINTKNEFENFKIKVKKEINPLISILRDSLRKWRL